jgi:hypothetical protein
MDRDQVCSLWMPPGTKRIVMTVVMPHRWTFLLKVMPFHTNFFTVTSDPNKPYLMTNLCYPSQGHLVQLWNY